MPKPSTITTYPTAFESVILVCRKCSKKLDGGFGTDGDQSLSRELKRGFRAAGRGRSSRVMETKCLGVCPKGAVTVLPASAPGTMLVVPAGTDAASVMASLPLP